MKRILFGLCVLILVTAPRAWAGPLDGSYRGNALIRTDAAHRIVVVLDEDGDGLGDQAFLFDPLKPLPREIAPFTKLVNIRVAEPELALDAADESVSMRLSTALPRQGERATAVSGTHTVAYGAALVQYRLAALPERFRAALAQVPTDELTTLDTTPAPCGQSDTDCSAGGRGSVACSYGCPSGGGSNIGVTLTVAGASGGQTKETVPPCSTSCGTGYYSCCMCDTGASNKSGPAPKCSCRDSAALQPCPR